MPPNRASMMTLLALAACNQAPEGLIIGLKPLDPTTTDDLEVKVMVEAADSNRNDVLTYDIAWSVDGVAQSDLAGQGRVPADRTHKGETWTVAVTASDGREAVEATASVEIADTAPTVAVTLPAYPSADEPLVATASADDVDDDDVDLTWSWKLDGVDAGIDSAIVPADRLARGQVWEVTVIAFDGDLESIATTSVTLGDAPPLLESITFEPAEPTTDTDLSILPIARDIDDDTIEYAYAWTRNGLPLDEQGPTLSSAAFERGDVIGVTVVPFDGANTGSPMTRQVTVGNSLPSVASAKIAPASPKAGDTLTCVPDEAFDADGDEVAYVVGWEIAEIRLVEAETLTPDLFRKGETITCVLVPYDGYELGTAVASPTTTVENTPPRVTGGSLSPDPVYGSDTLSVAYTVEDPDDDLIAASFQWYVNGVPTGRNRATLSASSINRGDVVTVDVTVSDGPTTADAYRIGPVAVRNTPPVIDSVEIAEATIQENTGVSVVVGGSDADGDAYTLSYAWTVNGAPAGRDRSTLAASAFTRGDVIQVTVTAHDGFDASAPVASASRIVENTAPIATRPTISPSVARTGDTLSCATHGGSDDDGDSLTFATRWYVDGVDAGASLTLDGEHVRRGARVECGAVAFDGLDHGAEARSAALTVGNRAPVIQSAFVAAPDPGTNAPYTISGITTSDAEDDEISFDVTWLVDDVATATGASFDAGSVAAGARIHASVVPNDGIDFGEAYVTEAVAVVNRPPRISDVAFDQPSYRTEDTIHVGFDAVDPDGDALTLAYTWYVNGDPVTGYDETFPGDEFAKNDVVWVMIEATDPTGGATSATSAPLFIENSLPSTPGLELADLEPAAGADIECALSEESADADGDDVAYRFTFAVNGDVVDQQYTTETFAVLSWETIDADLVSCTYEVSDGSDWIFGDEIQTMVAVGLVSQGGINQWSDGYAASCAEYRDPPFGYVYNVDASAGTGGSRLYHVDPDGDDIPEAVYCDMETDGGGWTLMARFEQTSAWGTLSSTIYDAYFKDDMWTEGAAGTPEYPEPNYAENTVQSVDWRDHLESGQTYELRQQFFKGSGGPGQAHFDVAYGFVYNGHVIQNTATGSDRAWDLFDRHVLTDTTGIAWDIPVGHSVRFWLPFKPGYTGAVYHGCGGYGYDEVACDAANAALRRFGGAGIIGDTQDAADPAGGWAPHHNTANANYDLVYVHQSTGTFGLSGEDMTLLYWTRLTTN